LINFPDNITIDPPGVPNITMAPPLPPSVVVVPVQGPPGPAGPPGDSVAALSFVQNVTPSMTTVLINHNLPFQPAGVLCLETTGATVLGATVTHPQTGWIELQFGAPFSGNIFLS
jgi:hypothetical protein